MRVSDLGFRVVNRHLLSGCPRQHVLFGFRVDHKPTLSGKGCRVFEPLSPVKRFGVFSLHLLSRLRTVLAGFRAPVAGLRFTRASGFLAFPCQTNAVGFVASGSIGGTEREVRRLAKSQTPRNQPPNDGGPLRSPHKSILSDSNSNPGAQAEATWGDSGLQQRVSARILTVF